MNKQEKIELLKAIQSGDTEKLERLRQVKRNSAYFFPVFFYVCEHGRVVNTCFSEGTPLLTLGDFPELKKMMETKDLSLTSLETLLKGREVFKTMEYLDERGFLKTLNPEQSKTGVSEPFTLKLLRICEEYEFNFTENFFSYLKENLRDK